ncbi:hypothetical protein EMQ25_02670 [Arsenicitalea aurantiaca]|uniref:Uncharacterized protein n=1 Tax=Arsenicitalea aurantiaca TaxID=1783274 RepID=A0A433XLB9_9HYPH|nr:hypothetical protein [Arsenicitalea aurantiaca]RUT34879.1 hypothetical protein EMQ25_02670 [Arsenicitalea aurantiaca]
MIETNRFTVQPLAGQDDAFQRDRCIHVDACSALEAAQKALAEPLTVTGQPDKLRAKVFHLGRDYQPVTVLLYSRAS